MLQPKQQKPQGAQLKLPQKRFECLMQQLSQQEVLEKIVSSF